MKSIIILSILFIISICATVLMHENKTPAAYKQCVVINKHNGTSTGKYAHNEFLVAVKANFDGQLYTKEVQYHTYQQLQIGQTYSFWFSGQELHKYDNKLISWGWSFALMLIFGFISALLFMGIIDKIFLNYE